MTPDNFFSSPIDWQDYFYPSSHSITGRFADFLCTDAYLAKYNDR